jgi:hypothetical protein
VRIDQLIANMCTEEYTHDINKTPNDFALVFFKTSNRVLNSILVRSEMKRNRNEIFTGRAKNVSFFSLSSRQSGPLAQ